MTRKTSLGRQVNRDLKKKQEPVLQGGPGGKKLQREGRADETGNRPTSLGAENRTKELEPGE